MLISLGCSCFYEHNMLLFYSSSPKFTRVSETWIKAHKISCKKMHSIMSVECRQFRPGLDVVNSCIWRYDFQRSTHYVQMMQRSVIKKQRRVETHHSDRPLGGQRGGGFRWLIFISSVRQSVDKIVSALYLQQYLADPFHICTSYQANSEGVWLVKFV